MVEVDHCGTQESEFKIGPLQNLVKCLDTTYMLQSLFGWRVFGLGRSQSKLCAVNERLDGFPFNEPLIRGIQACNRGLTECDITLPW